ncbi:anti-sigma-D factor RsdA [Antrihabitans spumae]|uniref:Anti-sigma-D factor RsdA n=1 Tax=Antrihabitans spumae TaxID=3373370 RepID=A0ABW7KIW7_9NOCA
MARDSRRGRFGAGSQHGNPGDGSVADTGPIDIAAVRRDDELIDAIASDGPVATDSPDEYEIATLLASWRAEITSPPLPAAPDLDEVFAAVNQEIGARNARVNASGRLRLVRPIIGAAAAIALVVGGMTAMSYNAEPGDPLWKVKEVVFSDQADSTVANIDTTSDLQEAQRYIAEGNPQEAKARLDRAVDRADDVKDSTKRDDLIAMWDKLTKEVEKLLPVTPPSTTSSVPTTDTPSSPDPTSQVLIPDPQVSPDTSVPTTTDPTILDTTTDPVTEPPVTEPPVTEPPVTEPPVTEPPVTEPPVTEPPVTQPPVDEPPATQQPVETTTATEPR